MRQEITSDQIIFVESLIHCRAMGSAERGDVNVRHPEVKSFYLPLVSVKEDLTL